MVLVLAVVFLCLQGLVTLCLAYLYVLALAGVWGPRLSLSKRPAYRFAVAIPAHNEEATIDRALRRLGEQDYPAELFDLFVVADNCCDNTAEVARKAGALCLERHNLSQPGKGSALAWLLPQILDRKPVYNAVVVFDADTIVDASFLRVMEAMLRQGSQVIQGKHIIANPAEGWYAAVMHTAFAMVNRLRNLGRTNLRLSSMLMGDAMCLAREVLETHPWQTSTQTEDVEYWATLVLSGIHVDFAPLAIAHGEMVTGLRPARHQRARWMRGRAQVTRRLVPRLVRSGLCHLDWRQLDAAIELAMPSYSTLLMLTLFASGLWIIFPELSRWVSWRLLAATWTAFLAYPLLALLLEGAPGKLYLYLAFAPLYALWRTGLRLWVRLRPGSTAWVRTPRAAETAQGVVRPSSPAGTSDELQQ